MKLKFSFKLAIIFILLLSLQTRRTDAQVKIGANPTTIDARSVLEIESTNKGLLLPRLTTVQRNAVSGWKAGHFIYNVNEGCVQAFNGITWDCLGGNASASMDTADIRVVGTGNHISSDAGVGSNGSSVGSGTDNIAIGLNTLSSNSSGLANVALSLDALRNNTSGTFNVGVGFWSLRANTTGAGNTAAGTRALESNTTGGDNVALGRGALSENTQGSFNIGIGQASGENLTTGSSNIVIGTNIHLPSPFASNQLNIGNLIYGVNVNGQDNNISTGNIGIGTKNPNERLEVNGKVRISNLGGPDLLSDLIVTADATTGELKTIPRSTLGGGGSGSADIRVVGTDNHISSDAGVGSNGTNAGTGPNNIAIGKDAFSSATSGGNNVALGRSALAANNIGFQNTAVGIIALTSNTSGSNNVAVGPFALSVNTTGEKNIGIGNNALSFNTIGSRNTGVGHTALTAMNVGFDNTAFGNEALENITSGNENIAIGSNAGQNLLSGNHNLTIGTNADVPLTNGSNQLNIGNIIYGTNINGSFAAISTGNIGIGKKNPGSRLAVAGLPVFANNFSALSGGLSAGDFYRTATGAVMVAY